MKRFGIRAMMAASLLMLACGCSRREAPARAATGDVAILATFYPLYVMLLNITAGAGGVRLAMLAPADTGCLHDYQLTTKDMRTLEACDILVANGAGMEDFLDKALEIKEAASVITAADGFPLAGGNAHVWVSPAGAMHEVRRIADGLSLLDEARAPLYQRNAAAYVRRLEDLRTDMHTMLDAAAGSRIVTFHEAFPYFAGEFGLAIAAVIEREPGTAPSPQELEDVITTIRGAQAGGRTALFAEPQYASSAATIISRETGLPVYELDPAVTGPLSMDAYVTTMERNAQVLRTALEP